MDYTTNEVASLLGKSTKTISRYIKEGVLHPVKRKGKGNHFVNFFTSKEINSLLHRTDTTKATTENKKSNDINEEVLSMLKDTISILQEELKQKNEQLDRALLHTKDITSSLQFAQRENSLLMDRLALPIPNEQNSEAVLKWNKFHNIRDNVQTMSRQCPDKTKGQKAINIVKTVNNTRDNIRDSDRTYDKRAKELNRKKRQSILSWIFGK